MAQVNILSLLIAAFGIGIAIWAQVIDSGYETLEKINDHRWKAIAAMLMIFGTSILIMVFAVLVYATFGLAAIGQAMYFVFIALILSALPSISIIIKIFWESSKKSNPNKYLMVLIIGIGLSLIVALLIGQNAG